MTMKTNVEYLIIVAMALIVLSFSLAVPAPAQQPPCGPHSQMVETLENEFGEARTAIAMEASGFVMQVYRSLQNTWTILMTLPNGMTCAVATGTHWENVEPEWPGDPA